MTITTVELVVLSCFVLATLSLLVLVYLSYRYLYLIETMFSNSSFVAGGLDWACHADLHGVDIADYAKGIRV